MPIVSAITRPASRGMKRCQAGRRGGLASALGTATPATVTKASKRARASKSSRGCLSGRSLEWPPVQVDVAHKKAQATLRTRRQRQARIRAVKRLVLAAVLALVVGSLITAAVYAGSAGTLTSGESIAGVDVGGLSPSDAQRLLERRAAGLANVPVVVHVAGHTFRLRQAEVGARVDWAGAVDAARAKADGFGPIRGFRRLFMRAFGVTITPTASVEGHALD